MGGHAILWPAIAMTGVIFAVWFKLFVDRLGHMRRTPPTRDDFATGSAAMRYFEPVEMAANNLRNLFEMPVLFYALVALLFATGVGGAAQVVLGWAYAALRAGHSVAHIGARKVQRRFVLYLASCVVLAAMWVGFAVELAGVR